MRLRPALLGILAAAAIGCQPSDALSPPSPSQTSFAGAPALVSDRTILPLCGDEAVDVDGTGDAAARDCLWRAYDLDQAAELISRQSTIEGAPITLIVRVQPGRIFEVFIDQTRDPLSTGGWLRLTCPGLTRMEDDGVLAGLGDGCAETRIK